MDKFSLRCFDGRQWKEFKGFPSKEYVEKIADSLIHVGYKKARIIENDNNEVGSISVLKNYNTLMKECREKLVNHKNILDLNKALDIFCKIETEEEFRNDTTDRLLNIIAEYNAGEIDIAKDDIKKVEVTLVEKDEEGIEDALYHLTYWSDIDNLKKASVIMKKADIETVDLDLSISYLDDPESRTVNYEMIVLGVDLALNYVKDKMSDVCCESDEISEQAELNFNELA